MVQPYTVLILTVAMLSGCSPPSGESRLYGKWRSDVDATISRLKGEGGDGKEDAPDEESVRALLGRDEMVFSSDTVQYNGRAYSYEVVEKGPDFVVLHIADGVTLKGGKPLPRRFEFVRDGFWMSMPHALTRKFTRVTE